MVVLVVVAGIVTALDVVVAAVGATTPNWQGNRS